MVDQGNTIHATSPDNDWLVRQLEAWPERVDEEKTANLRYLLNRAAEEIRNARQPQSLSTSEGQSSDLSPDDVERRLTGVIHDMELLGLDYPLLLRELNEIRSAIKGQLSTSSRIGTPVNRQG